MDHNQYWKDQVVLVTGSSRGIGRAMALHFSQLGAKVIINYCGNEKAAFETHDLCLNETMVIKADVSCKNDVQEMFQKIRAKWGGVSILINNAGQTRDGLFMTMPDEDWHDLIGTHLNGAYYCSREALNDMLSNRFGRILNISSITGVKGQAGQVNYATVKAGLLGMTKALAREVGKKKITVNALVLGMIESDMISTVDPEVIKSIKKSTSVRRLGRPEEVASLASFLTGAESSYITGQSFVQDGGIL